MNCNKTLDPVKQNKTKQEQINGQQRNKFIHGKNRNKELKPRHIYCLVIRWDKQYLVLLSNEISSTFILRKNITECTKSQR